MTKKSPSDKELADMPFEKALARLEEIVSKMEAGDLALEEMLRCFEEGNRLSRYCGDKLRTFEKKIEVLTRETAAGGEWQEFDPESGRRLPSRPEAAPEPRAAAAADDAGEPEREEDLLF